MKNLNKILGFVWLILCVNVYANSTQTNQTNQTNQTKQTKQESIINPSFDCKKARTNTEKLICSDEELAALDRQMAQAYGKG